VGKLPKGEPMVRDFEQRLREDGFLELPITSQHSLRACSLPGPHRDPFDRMLAAQSLIEQFPVLTADEEIEAFGAARIW